MSFKALIVCSLLASLTVPSFFSSSAKEVYDVVILNGRVIDPESGLDTIRNVGVSGGVIKAITVVRPSGRTVIDVKGLVVSRGFIDLHQHGQTEENYRFKAMDGVTTALELEVGAGDVDTWYAERSGKAMINYGVSVGHLAARMAAMHDPIEFLPSREAARRSATDAEIARMKAHLEHGLRRGAVAVGFGIQYVPQASHWEILEMFRCGSYSVNRRGRRSGARVSGHHSAACDQVVRVWCGANDRLTWRAGDDQGVKAKLIGSRSPTYPRWAIARSHSFS